MRRWLAALGCAVALVGCDPGESGDDRAIVADQDLGLSGESVDKLERRPLEQFASLDLPASARIVRSYAAAGMDSLVEVTIEMDPDDLGRFANGSELPALEPSPNPFGPGTGRRMGWKVDDLREARFGEDVTPRGVHRRVALGRDGTVYLQAFET